MSGLTLTYVVGNGHVCGVHPWEDGAGDRSRTYDLLITNELLYQLSYTGNILGCGV